MVVCEGGDEIWERGVVEAGWRRRGEKGAQVNPLIPSDGSEVGLGLSKSPCGATGSHLAGGDPVSQ